MPVYIATLSFKTRGVTGTSCYRFEYNLHLIKIPAGIICERIYMYGYVYTYAWKCYRPSTFACGASVKETMEHLHKELKFLLKYLLLL